MDIKALQWELAAYVVDRGLDPLHTPKNLSMALAAEAGALLDLFKWTADDGAQGLARHDERDAAADSIADAVLHAVHLADRLGIDLEEAIRRKLAKNAEKYPAMTAEPAPAPIPAPAPERRAEPEKRPAPPRARAAVEPEMPARAAPRAAPPPPAREPPWVTRTPSPAPVAEPPPAPSPPPPARVARTEAPPPAPRPVRAEPPPPPPPPPRATRPEPPPPPLEPEPQFEPEPEPEPEPEVDPYANLDVDAARRIVEVLTKQVNRARSDDPLARELHDELSTLKRSLYSDNPKRAWLAGSLKSIRRILEEACSLAVGAELRAKEHLVEVERILDA